MLHLSPGANPDLHNIFPCGKLTFMQRLIEALIKVRGMSMIWDGSIEMAISRLIDIVTKHTKYLIPRCFE